MSLYRIYIDETGNHDMTHADDPNERFLALTGIIIESIDYSSIVRPEMEQIKDDFFRQDPDEAIIFHRKEMINSRPPFAVLRNSEIHNRFNKVLLEALDRWKYLVVTVVLDKKAHRDRYKVWHYHPYHYCLEVLLERYVLFLYNYRQKGDVMVESRGGQEDDKLKDSYNRLYESGTEHISAERWQAHLTSHELKVKPKSANIAGLQLADLLAHPSKREVLRVNNLISDDRDIFGDQICAILQNSKYRRSSGGRIQGYGTILLPGKENALSGVLR